MHGAFVCRGALKPEIHFVLHGNTVVILKSLYKSLRSQKGFSGIFDKNYQGIAHGMGCMVRANTVL